jgi:hypothetical protein
MPTSVSSVAKPVFKALEAAKAPSSLQGKKISRSETTAIAKAMDKALDVGFKKLSPEDLFQELPYAVGFAMMQNIKKSDFVNPKDFSRLWNKAVDIASAAPDIGNYLPD